MQAAKRPCPKLCASSDAPQSCSFDQLCCVAPNGRDRTAWLPVIAGLFRKQGISRLRARVGGFAVAPDTPSQRTLMRLDFHRCRGTRACGRESGALRSPPTPLRSAHPCFLVFIVAGAFASAEASRGLSVRPLHLFGTVTFGIRPILARRFFAYCAASAMSAKSPCGRISFTSNGTLLPVK